MKIYFSSKYVERNPIIHLKHITKTCKEKVNKRIFQHLLENKSSSDLSKMEKIKKSFKYDIKVFTFRLL